MCFQVWIRGYLLYLVKKNMKMVLQQLKVFWLLLRRNFVAIPLPDIANSQGLVWDCVSQMHLLSFFKGPRKFNSTSQLPLQHSIMLVPGGNPHRGGKRQFQVLCGFWVPPKYVRGRVWIIQSQTRPPRMECWAWMLICNCI